MSICDNCIHDEVCGLEDNHEEAITFCANMIPIEQGPNTGHWIIKDGKEQGYDIAGVKTWYIQIMCDKCGFIKTAIEGHTGQYHFCPNCGARMERRIRNDRVKVMSVLW